MLSTQFVIKSKVNQFLLAEFWLQSEKPMDLQECRHAIEAMGYRLDTVNWETPKCIETDDTASKVATLIDAFLPYTQKLTQAPDGVKHWSPQGWRETAIVNECLTEQSARKLAIDWLCFEHEGISEDTVIANAIISVRYVEKLEYAKADDNDPF